MRWEKITKETFPMAYAIMEEAFPPSELRTQEGQEALLAQSQYRLYAFYEEERCCGICGIWEWDDFVYVEHLAVAPQKRNGGMGSKILQALIAAKQKAVLLEVELPENEISRRRIGFYERNGFQLNPYDYLQPPMRAGQPMFPLRLMTYPEKIDEKTYLHRRNCLYEKVYRYRLPSQAKAEDGI